MRRTGTTRFIHAGQRSPPDDETSRGKGSQSVWGRHQPATTTSPARWCQP
jgi:hypothetical protein